MATTYTHISDLVKEDQPRRTATSAAGVAAEAAEGVQLGKLGSQVGGE
jgi:hypothetical protein